MRVGAHAHTHTRMEVMPPADLSVSARVSDKDAHAGQHNSKRQNMVLFYILLRLHHGGDWCFDLVFILFFKATRRGRHLRVTFDLHLEIWICLCFGLSENNLYKIWDPLRSLAELQPRRRYHEPGQRARWVLRHEDLPPGEPGMLLLPPGLIYRQAGVVRGGGALHTIQLLSHVT